MIRTILFASAAAAMMFAASPSQAKRFVDYMPEKGVWLINAVEVDPNHVDDYLTGLRRSQVPDFEILKKHGIIDAYRFIVRAGYSKGKPNVLIETHYPNAAMLVPDETRDMAIEAEIRANFSDEAGKLAVAGYEKYREFLDQAQWREVRFAR